ncbi:thioesterase family protein [Variovorax sp. OV329]|uniref:acyl-CoA thioesterase n=1 Tax=Variovorax sp. OV329 TaxID=1882825 RepID=UPI0008E5D270|nr:acyl-CoA thioesterase [Variovorax sp. OV329]SFL88719.1 4-hydroxybenzoyl-CoA thioesterase [Variovorax sp. OV329]
MSSSKTVIHTVHVEFGDCDPAGIVWFPNFFRWIDAASRHFFVACGVPHWTETAKTLGVIGTPLVNTQTRFVASASYGDTLDIATRVSVWRTKSFVQAYTVTRGDTLVLECEEVRIFGGKREDGSLCALPVPEVIARLCGRDA